MRPSESNSLLRGLAANPAGEHPDADLLTAFREGSLLERERETVMGHLAVCAECRDVLNLSAVQQERTELRLELVATGATRPKSVSGPNRRIWLRWAVAASLAIVSVIAVRLAHRREQPPTQMAELKSPPPVAAPLAQAAPVPQRQNQVRDKKAVPSSKRPVQVAKDDAVGGVARSPEADQRQSKVAANKQAPPGQSQLFYQPPTQRMQQFGLSESKSQAEAQRQMRSLPQADSEEKKSGTESADAKASEKRAGMPNPPAPAFVIPFSGDAMSKAQPSTVARPHWRINDQGRPERSYGNGRWEPVLANDPAKMHVLLVANGQVWVGGENDRVYRSHDEGTTWQLVNLPLRNGTGHVIGHIRFESPLNGTIEAADGTAWTTSDGGATWK